MPHDSRPVGLKGTDMSLFEPFWILQLYIYIYIKWWEETKVVFFFFYRVEAVE